MTVVFSPVITQKNLSYIDSLKSCNWNERITFDCKPIYKQANNTFQHALNGCNPYKENTNKVSYTLM